MANDRGESDPLEAVTSKFDLKMNLLNDVMADYREIKQVISGATKEKESLQQEKERLQQEEERLQQEKERLLHGHLDQFCMNVESGVMKEESLQQEKERLEQEEERLQQEEERLLHEHLENGDVLARMKEDILASKKTWVEARDSLVSSTELISQKDKYVEFLKKKLQKSEAKNNQAEQQDIGDSADEECNDSVTKTPAKNSSSKRHMMATCNGMPTSSKKQKTTTKNSLLISSEVTNQGKQGHSSLEHMEVQDLGKKAMCMSPEDEAANFLKPPTICLDDSATMKNIKRMSQIKQNVEETVQKYVENAATIFDPSTLPPPPKKLDQTPGAALKLPESACSTTEYVFRHVITDLKNLQRMAIEEKFNQTDFLKEVTTVLNGWEIFFSCHFTEEIKQMVTKIKILKKELDDESSHWAQETIQGLSERNEKVGEMLMKANLVGEEITNYRTEIKEMKVARIKSQKKLSALEIEYTNSIQERERKIAKEMRKIAEEKKNLGLIQSLEKSISDFFHKGDGC